MTKRKLLMVDNSQLYYQAREQISAGKKTFEVSDELTWPSAPLVSSKGHHLGQLQVSPDVNKVDPAIMNQNELDVWQQTMVGYVSTMNDLTADVFDILTIEWLKNAKTPTDTIEIDVDDILRYRGIVPALSGQKRLGGYRPQQREAVAKQIQLLDHIWIEAEREIMVHENGGKRLKKQKMKGRAVHLHLEYREQDEEGNTELLLIRARPGDIFSHTLFSNGRKTALLSKKALEYDVDKFAFEKRLTRYFSYLWRNRQKDGSYSDNIEVKRLLGAIRLQLNEQRPMRTFERLENALNRLQRDEVIESWQFREADLELIGKRGWGKKMLNWKVEVVPPESITEHYTSQIKNPIEIQQDSTAENLADKVKETRKNRSLNLSQAAEQMGINIGTLSRIENMKTSPRGTTKQKINQWLKS